MRVAVQQEFYVRQFEAELGDIALDLRRGFDKAAVEEEMSFWCGDQVRRDFNRADVIQVSGDPEWRYRFVPAPARFICLSQEALSRERKADQDDDGSQHERLLARCLPNTNGDCSLRSDRRALRSQDIFLNLAGRSFR